MFSVLVIWKIYTVYFLNTAWGLRRGASNETQTAWQDPGKMGRGTLRDPQDSSSRPSLDSTPTHMLKRLRPMRYSRLRRVSVESVGDLQLAGFSQW